MAEGGQALVASVRQLRAELLDRVAKPVELPEPDAVLDLASRKGDDVRVYKHIVQTATLHREHFAHSARIKHMYTIDAFLSSVDDENPIALYAAARSMFELSAFLYEVRSRLVETAELVNDKTWLPMGEKFFALLVRARYATTHPEFRALLLKAGVPKARLEPFNVTRCVSRLAATEEYADAKERYDLLCDYVHHNLGSATTSNSGVRIGDTSYMGAGRLITPGEGTITRYEYPVVGKFPAQVDRVAKGFLRDARACVRWVNETPQGPFPIDMNERVTGDPLGLYAVFSAEGHR